MDFSMKKVRGGRSPGISIRSDSLETSAAVCVFESPATRTTTGNLLPPGPCDMRCAPEAGTSNPEGGNLCSRGSVFAKMSLLLT